MCGTPLIVINEYQTCSKCTERIKKEKYELSQRKHRKGLKTKMKAPIAKVIPQII